MENGISIQFVLITACLCISSMSWNLIMATNSNMPIPMEEMFNRSFSKHFDGYLTDIGIASIWSANAYGVPMAQILSVFLVYPLLDTKGPKFIYVQLRLAFMIVIFGLSSLAFFLPSFEAYLLGSWISGLIRLPSLLASSFYQNEITPPKYRGVIVSITALVEALEAILTLNLTRPAVFGSADSWIYLHVLAFLLTLIPSFYFLYLPDPFKKERRRFSTYGSIDAFDGMAKRKSEIEPLKEPLKFYGKMDVIRDASLRKILLLMLCLQIFIDVSPKTVENIFFVRLHELFGFNQDIIMTIGTIQRIVFIPIYFGTAVIIKKYGTRFAALSAIFIMYLKNLATLCALSFAYLSGPSTISQILGLVGDVLTGIHSCFGFIPLFYLILFETAPIYVRTSIAQIANLISMALTAIFLAVVPYAFNFFSPLPFLIILVLYPILMIYVYRNLPNGSREKSANEEKLIR